MMQWLVHLFGFDTDPWHGKKRRAMFCFILAAASWGLILLIAKVMS